jgi:hypothetical protein
MENSGHTGSWASMIFHDDNFVTVSLRNRGGRGNFVNAKVKVIGAVENCAGADISYPPDKTVLIAKRPGMEVDFVCERTDQTKSAYFVISFEDGPEQVLYLHRVPPTRDDPIEAKIIRIETPVDKGEESNWAETDDLWDRTFPLRTGDLLGIGHIVDPGTNSAHLLGTPFAIQRKYHLDKKPDVTYFFDKPAQVAALQIFQHTNGVLKVEEFVGDDPDNLTSIGIAKDPKARTQRDRVFPDGEEDVFVFEKPYSGLVFRFSVKESSLPNGTWAIYRAYPLDQNNRKFRVDF